MCVLPPCINASSFRSLLPCDSRSCLRKADVSLEAVSAVYSPNGCVELNNVPTALLADRSGAYGSNKPSLLILPLLDFFQINHSYEPLVIWKFFEDFINNLCQKELVFKSVYLVFSDYQGLVSHFIPP